MKCPDLAGISIYVDEKSAHPIYEELVSRSRKKADDFPFTTMKDLFLIAACIGAHHDLYKEPANKRDIFSGEQFREKIDLPVLAALAYQKKQDIEILSNPREIIDIAQCYANEGIHILREELLVNPGLSPLYNLVELVTN